MDEIKTCCYKEDNGHECHAPALASGLCYWHDPKQLKDSPDTAKQLEEFAHQGGMLRGIHLRHANLEGIDLVHHHSKTGYDMSHADLYRANLQGAHLFNLNLDKANVMKADLRDANLHLTKLSQANLLGVKWAGAKIENVHIGGDIIQEQQAYRALKLDEHEIAQDYFEQAEEIYRDLRKAAEHEGLFAMAGEYIQKELTMRRQQMPKYSQQRMVSKLIDMFCGYGEAPLRVIFFSLALIVCCACVYFFTGLMFNGQTHVAHANMQFSEYLSLFFNCLYYSVVTFTTLGYGDFTPVGFSKAVAAFEAFTGSFTIALFVVVFVKKMTR
ncbi:pentapeptide repeat-containing protein [Shewanella sp. NIFS-20-20]|nr:pentapeptide repeat-containing protein [Shewanella sp. NIFS-20-20]